MSYPEFPKFNTAINALENELEEKQAKLFSDLSTWDRVLLARHPDRPYTLDYIEEIFTDFMELKGDKVYGDDPAIIGGFAKLNGEKLMLIGHQKGRTVAERQYRNFGMAHPEGYRKALRLMKLAEKTNTPIITFIDTPGAYPGLASEERHIGKAIADNLMECFLIKVPIISIVIGEGGSGGALGIGVADNVFMLENSYYSVISPEGCASILWVDANRAEEAAKELKISSQQLKELGIVEEFIKEPLGGAHKDFSLTFKNTKEILVRSLKALQKKSKRSLLDSRYHRFKNFGRFKK